MRNAKLSNFIFLLSLTILITGCAGAPAIKMNIADKANIKVVSMQTLPTLPTEMFFNGRAQTYAAAGGYIGAELAKGIVEPKAELLATMKANKIDLPLILKSEFFQASAAVGAITLADAGTMAQGDLSLTVNVYGFGQTQGFSALLFPLINVTATLKKTNGEIAWQRTEFVTPLNSENKYGYEFTQYTAKPELLRETLTNISKVVSRLLVEGLGAGN